MKHIEIWMNESLVIVTDDIILCRYLLLILICVNITTITLIWMINLFYGLFLFSYLYCHRRIAFLYKALVVTAFTRLFTTFKLCNVVICVSMSLNK